MTKNINFRNLYVYKRQKRKAVEINKRINHHRGGIQNEIIQNLTRL